MDMFPEIFYLSVGFVLMAVAFYSVLAAIVFPFFIEDYKSKMGYVWVFSLLYLTVVLSNAFSNWVGFIIASSAAPISGSSPRRTPRRPDPRSRGSCRQ